MEIEPIDLRDGVSVDVSFSKVNFAGTKHRDALVVIVRGKTGIGSGSNTDAGYIEGMARAARSMVRPMALIFDFREFGYEWGDQLHSTLAVGDGHYVDSEFPTAVVVSDLCRKGLTSLVKQEMLADPADWLFPSIESALVAVEAQVALNLKSPRKN